MKEKRKDSWFWAALVILLAAVVGTFIWLLFPRPLVEIVDDQYGVCDGAQALLVVTEWNQFRNPDFDRIKSLLTAPLLFDGRNLYSPAAMGSRGFAYFCIGRRPD